MMENTLLIHIGMPKTGTSALQKFLFINADRLEQYGWSYPTVSDVTLDFNIHGIEESIAEKFYRHYVGKPLEFCNDMRQWECILGYLENNNVLLSSEAIAICDTEKFLKCAKENYENIKVVIYLRRQDREVESIYNQKVRQGSFFGTIKDYIEAGETRGWGNYLSKLETISEIVGKENLIARVYEKNQLSGKSHSIEEDFLSVLGIDKNLGEWEECGKQHSALHGNYYEIRKISQSIRQVNHVAGYEIGDEECYTMLFDQLSNFFGQSKGEEGFFTTEERKEFLSQFEAENERVAREFLGREDGILFYDNRMDYPMYGTNQYSSFEADIIRVFSSMIGLQGWKIRQMEKHHNAIVKSLLLRDILQKGKGRKLMLFGAGENCKKLFDIVENIPAVLIADNDIAKDNTVFNKVQVRYARDIADWQDYFVVVTCNQTDQVEQQLCGLGLCSGVDYILAKEYGV